MALKMLNDIENYAINDEYYERKNEIIKQIFATIFNRYIWNIMLFI